VVNFWDRQGQGLGAHVLIDKDGNSALGADPHFITWAVRHANTGSVHFELIGFARFTPKLWWARLKQLNKLAKWLAWLNLEYGIELKRSRINGVAGHREFPGNDHTDPGKWFPWRFVLRRAREYRKKGWA
jgi:N-acetyl-anhydromuramyl-L-alanine amidase AmpD